MESDKVYRTVFYVGTGWNITVAIGMFIMLGSLPTMIHIEPPRYPMFIEFNLMTTFFFGIIQLTIARNLYSYRSFVTILMWAKLVFVFLYCYSIVVDAPPKELVGFLAPGMVIDFLFGLAFWRFLVFSRRRSAQT